jgi:hypothetical protein
MPYITFFSLAVGRGNDTFYQVTIGPVGLQPNNIDNMAEAFACSFFITL